MEIKELTPQHIELIKKPLPAEAISPHPTKPYLSSIKAIYVTERLNEVFGIWAWRIKTDKIEDWNKWMVVVKVIFEVPRYWIYYESFWWNDNWWEWSKNFDLWDAYKWATTDAITKIASYIGIWIDVFKWKQKWWIPQTWNPKQEYWNTKWYNDVDKNLQTWRDLVIQWKTTPQAIIDKIEADWFRINNDNKKKILDLF